MSSFLPLVGVVWVKMLKMTIEESSGSSTTDSATTKLELGEPHL
jgi:hypothetical protein